METTTKLINEIKRTGKVIFKSFDDEMIDVVENYLNENNINYKTFSETGDNFIIEKS